MAQMPERIGKFTKPRDISNQRGEPRNRTRDGYNLRGFMQALDGRMFLAILQHAELYSQGNIAHHVERIARDPVGDIHWLSLGPDLGN